MRDQSEQLAEVVNTFKVGDSPGHTGSHNTQRLALSSRGRG